MDRELDNLMKPELGSNGYLHIGEMQQEVLHKSVLDFN